MSKYKIECIHLKDNPNTVTLHCSRCLCRVDPEDHYCRNCGQDLETGQQPDNAYKAGYNAAKRDMIRILKGGNDFEIK